MLKRYTGKKISVFMEKTTMDFVLVAFGIYHVFFFFLDLPLVVFDVDTI